MMPPRLTQPDLAQGAAAPAWDNPIPTGRYDLVVLGADRAARWAAAEAASLGASVAWIVGEADGMHREAVADGIDVYRGAPHFIAPDALHLAGRRLHFVRALLAADATPIVPPIDGFASVPRLDAATLATLAAPPRRVAVIGAGATGCAAAQTLARRGSRVTLFEAEGRILPREAPDAAAIIAAALAADGVRVLAGHRVVAAAKQARAWALSSVIDDDDRATGAVGGAGAGDESIKVEASKVEATQDIVDAVVLAAGRRTDLQSLDLAAAAVEMDGDRLRLDARLRTTNPRIYAAGDVALDHPSPHGALATAHVALRNALFDGRRRTDILTIPRTVWTVPQLASVGLLVHEPDAADVPLDTLIHRTDGTNRPPSMSNGSEVAELVTIHLAAGTDVLLGATLVGPDAATAIGEVAHAIDAGIGLTDLSRAIRPPGAFADGLQALADEARRRRRSQGGRALATRWLAARRALADRGASGG